VSLEYRQKPTNCNKVFREKILYLSYRLCTLHWSQNRILEIRLQYYWYLFQMFTCTQPCKFGGITMDPFHHQLFWTMSTFSGSSKSSILPSSVPQVTGCYKVRNATVSVPLVNAVQCSKLATTEFLSTLLVNTENELNMGITYVSTNTLNMSL
jgi:hypothetical protein